LLYYGVAANPFSPSFYLLRICFLLLLLVLN